MGEDRNSRERLEKSFKPKAPPRENGEGASVQPKVKPETGESKPPPPPSDDS